MAEELCRRWVEGRIGRRRLCGQRRKQSVPDRTQYKHSTLHDCKKAPLGRESAGSRVDELRVARLCLQNAS